MTSVELRAKDDLSPGKLSETMHRVDFHDTCDGIARVSRVNLGEVFLGEVVTDGFDSVTETSRVTVLLPVTGRVGLQRNGVTQKATGADTLLVQPGIRQNYMRADRSGRARTLAAFVPLPPCATARKTQLPAMMSVGASAEARSLRGFLDYAFAELRNADSPLRRPAASGAIEAVVTDAVQAFYGIAAPLPSTDATCPARVRAARDYMHAHADEALTVEQIARAVGIGPRALQAAFRDGLGMTPREVLAEIRLERARSRLLSPERGTTVTDAALDSGFAHLGRFAGAYRQRYGESPSQTLRRAIR